jgi:hypothetical protein
LIRWINLMRTMGIPDAAAPMTTPTLDATVDAESATTENSLQVSTERRLPMWDPKYVDEERRTMSATILRANYWSTYLQDKWGHYAMMKERPGFGWGERLFSQFWKAEVCGVLFVMTRP